jgi:hypothetical protein
MRATKALITGGTALALALGAGTAALAEQPDPAPTPSGSASEQLAADLVFSREEERLAGDLYRLFAEQYPDQRVFQRIPLSEDRHFEHIGSLLTAYGLDDPSAGLPAGTYADPELQALYDEWAAEGLQSEQDALEVGIELETEDIADLEAMIARTDDGAADATFQRLLDGSERHLDAFTAAAEGTLPGTGGGGPGGPGGSGPGPWAGEQGRLGSQDCLLDGTGRHGRQGGPGYGGWQDDQS